MSDTRELYRRLPRMDDLLEHPEVERKAAERGWGRAFVRTAAERWLEAVRSRIAAGAGARQVEAMLESPIVGIETAANELLSPHLRRVLNATGVVVHTNLGRSPWPESAAARVASLSRRYLNLEYDLEAGGRGDRDRPAGKLADALFPGAEVAVVNNNAAAVLLVLNTFAEGGEVIVSRGQLVEIGGSFRIPDVMRKAMCRLREVGTTNRTRRTDFEAAIGPETRLLMAVHPSNYRMVGFTASVPIEELVQLGADVGLPVVEDLGSGCLVPMAGWGIAGEPTVAERLETGVDLLTFSGDKLLGGPQAGFVVGKPEAVAKVRANPLYRALRLDKATLLALEATLADYVAGRPERIPTLRMLSMPGEELRARAEGLAEDLRGTLADADTDIQVDVVELESRAGGGAAPEVALPSWGIAVTVDSPDELATRLRAGEPAVVGRIVEDRWVADVRTLLEGEAEDLVEALVEVLTAEK